MLKHYVTILLLMCHLRHNEHHSTVSTYCRSCQSSIIFLIVSKLRNLNPHLFFLFNTIISSAVEFQTPLEIKLKVLMI